MRLTRYTDFSLRVLIYLGVRPGRVSAISEIARAYGVSHNHLMKVVHDLGKAGLVESERGRLGGVRLAKEPAAINIGALVRRTESDDLVECGACVIAPACGLSSALDAALDAFLSVLDGYTLQDLIQKRRALQTLLRA